MADLQSTIDLIFNGIDQASDVARKVSGEVGGLANAAKTASQPLVEMSGKLAIVQVGITALAGVIGSLAFNESREMQSSLAELNKQLDESDGSAEQYGRTLETLALKYGENNNELVKSAADFKAAGYDIGTSIELVKGSLDLAIAGSIETSTAVDIMNRSLAGFQVPAKDVVATSKLIGDNLNKAADITKSSFSELAKGFADLSPIAKQTGLSVQETVAILTEVIDVFGSGSEAANGLKSGFLSLVDPSKESAKAMADLGVEYKNSDGTLKSVKQILSELAPAFSNVDESQKLAAASAIFGKDQAAKMVQVMVTYGDAMQRASVLTKEAGGSIENEVNKQLALTEIAVKRADEAFRQLLQSIGDKTESGLIGSISDLAIAFRDVVRSGDLDPLFSALNSQLGEIESLFKTVANNLPAAFSGVKFDGLLVALGELKSSAKVALEALFGPIDLTTVDGLRNALQKIVDLLEGLTRITSGELGGLAPFLAGINKMAQGFLDAEGSTKGFVGTLLGLGVGVNAASGYLDSINTALLSIIALGPKTAAAASSITSEIGLLAAGLAGPQGIAIALGAAAAAIVTFLVPADQLADYAWPDWLAGYSGATPGTAAADIAEGFASLSARIKQLVSDADKVPAALDKTTPIVNADNAISEIRRFEEEVQRGKDEYDDLINFMAKPVPINSWDGVLAKLSNIEPESNNARQAISDLSAEIEKKLVVKGDFSFGEEPIKNLKKTWDENGNPVFSAIDNATIKATGSFAAFGSSVGESAKKVEEATKKSEDFQVKMEQIASNERIKNIEAIVSINTERLKADTERVKATFSSIDTTIKSTGDLLGSLFGNLVGTDDPFKSSKIESQIALENERRQKALDIQKQLAEAEIERIQAQTRALDRGDAILKIDGTGLEPELEAFMWKILKKIRVRANAEYSDYLLGLATT